MKRIIRPLLVLLTAVGLLTGLAPEVAHAAEAPAPTRCDEGHWPASVQGRPKSFKVGGAAGYYVWHDAKGWHLRTTTPTASEHTFSGVIVSSGTIKTVHTFRDEARDTVSTSGKRLKFRFHTYDKVDGVDFTVGCTERVAFDLQVEGHRISPRRIWLGATGHAPHNPFVVQRIA